MATKIGRPDYVPDIYPCAELQNCITIRLGDFTKTINPIESKSEYQAETLTCTSWLVCSYTWKHLYGWRPPSWKSLWHHNSTADGPIWTKFDRQMQNSMPMVMQTWKSKPRRTFVFRNRK